MKYDSNKIRDFLSPYVITTTNSHLFISNFLFHILNDFPASQVSPLFSNFTGDKIEAQQLVTTWHSKNIELKPRFPESYVCSLPP